MTDDVGVAPPTIVHTAGLVNSEITDEPLQISLVTNFNDEAILNCDALSLIGRGSTDVGVGPAQNITVQHPLEFLERVLRIDSATTDNLEVRVETLEGFTLDARASALEEFVLGTSPRPSIIGDAASFFTSYFTNPGHAVVGLFDRVKVGVAAASGSDIPQTSPDWLESLGAGFSSEAQLTVIGSIGTLGIVGAARTSDYRTWAGAASQGSQGITGFAYNDDTASGAPIARAVAGVAVRTAGALGVTLSQLDVCDKGTLVDVDAFTGVINGTTYALGLTPGAYGSIASTNISAALYIGKGVTTRFRRGIEIFDGSLDTGVGAGGNGLAVDLARSMSIRWTNGTHGVDAEIWGDTLGLFVNNKLSVNGDAYVVGDLYVRSPFLLRNDTTSWGLSTFAFVGTLNNAPIAGNPQKWIPIDDHGTTLYIPAWHS